MTNSRTGLLKARFAWIRTNLDEIIDRITPEILDWAPAEGMRTVSGQLAEIAWAEIPLVPYLKDGVRMDEDAVDALIGDTGNLVNLRRCLNEVRGQTLGYLDSLTDAQLEEEIMLGRAWYGTFWPERVPRAEVFLNIAEHELYHVGQLVTYLWARGDDPYRW